MAHVLLSSLGVICGACDELNPASAAACRSCRQELRDVPVALLQPKSRPALHVTPPPQDNGITPQVEPPAPSSLASSFAQVRLPPSQPAPPPSPAAASPAQPPPRWTPQPPAQPVPPNLGRTPAPVLGPRASLAPAPHPGGPASPPPSPARPVSGSRFIVGVVAGPARGQRFRLMATGCSVGRSKGAILFPDDTFVSPQHAAFRVKDGNLFLKDESGASGVYVSISQPELLAEGRLFCVGQRVFRYVGALAMPVPVPGKPVPYGSPVPGGSTQYLIEELLVGGRAGRAVITAGPLFTIGQGPCDLAFPHETGLASRHCELRPGPGGAILRDLSGGLGTFVRMGNEERALSPGDRIRIGQQTLQIELSA